MKRTRQFPSSVDMINSFPSGRATYIEFPGMGHGLDRIPSRRAWLEAIQKHEHGPFDQEFLKQIANWLDKIWSGGEELTIEKALVRARALHPFTLVGVCGLPRCGHRAAIAASQPLI